MRYVADDVALAQALQHLVALVSRELGLRGYERLVYVAIVGEKASITAKQRRHHGLVVARQGIELIQVVAPQQDVNSRCRVGVGLIMQVAGIVKDMERGVYLDGKQMIGSAKLPYVESEGVASAASQTHAVIESQAVVHIIYIVLGWEVLVDAPRQLAHVAAVPQQYGVSLLPSRPARPASWK